MTRPGGGGSRKKGGTGASTATEILPDDCVDLAARVSNQLFFDRAAGAAGVHLAEGPTTVEITQIVKQDVTQQHADTDDEGGSRSNHKLKYFLPDFYNQGSL